MRTITATAGPGVFVPWPQLPSHIRKATPHLAPIMATTLVMANWRANVILAAIAHAGLQRATPQNPNMESVIRR